MKNPLVSIIIPTYNRKNMLIRLVDSLLGCTYPNLEIIIVDDASKDDTFESVKLKYGVDKRVKILRNKVNLFAAGSKNTGVKIAKGKFITFIDDDNVVQKNMIEELVKVMDENPDIGEIGPINYSFKNKDKIIFSKSCRNMWTTKTFHLRSIKELEENKKWETEDMPNAFMVRGDILKKFNIKFNTKFGIMYEESDYAYRIRKAGYKVMMARNAKIYHDIEDSESGKNYLSHFLKDPRRSFTFARNRIIFHSKYSTNIQKVGIYLFWVWVFTFYYCYKLITYTERDKYSLSQKFKSVYNYFFGDLKGLYLVMTGNEFIQ